MLLAAVVGQIEVGGPRFLPLLVDTHGGDDQGVVLECIQPVLLVAIVGFDFPDFAPDLFVELFRHDKAGIFLKELYAHGDRLSPIIIQSVEPFTDRFGAVG